jgi:hypothetical protein
MKKLEIKGSAKLSLKGEAKVRDEIIEIIDNACTSLSDKIIAASLLDRVSVEDIDRLQYELSETLFDDIVDSYKKAVARAKGK